MNKTSLLQIAASLFLALTLGACQEPAQDQSSRTAAAPCADCGEIESITPRVVKGEASPASAVAGAIIGGVLGHQFGDGSGRKAATAAGAIGGAVAGSEIEKRRNSYTVYELVVRLDSGDRRELTRSELGALNVGDRVQLRGDSLVPLQS